jgi:hydroxyacylglutathione hydrolase
MIKTIVVGLMSTNAYIYTDTDGGCYVIDPGGDADAIIEILESKNLHLTGILCTHGHLDHTGSAGPLLKYFNAQDPPPFLAIHKNDSHYLGERAEDTHRRSFASLGILGTGYFQMIFNPSPDPDLVLEDGMTIPGSSIEVLHTPGHTQGGVCFLNRKEKILFSGDTLFSRGIGRTDLPEGDGEKLFSSIREKLYPLPDDIAVYPGHGPATTIGEEKSSNPFVR